MVKPAQKQARPRVEARLSLFYPLRFFFFQIKIAATVTAITATAATAMAVAAAGLAGSGTCSSVIPFFLGILIAVLLTNPHLRGRKIFKFIYVLPWAIPGYITLLVLQSMFDTGYGFINQILGLFGIENIRWLTSVGPARCALLLVSVWTGFSYPMMLSENIIKSIPKDVYEAATLDGATGFSAFWHITFPLVMNSISPIFIMTMAGAFNNFNTIYLITGGGPLNLDYQSAGSTDILITWLFKLTITNNKYNYGAAISTILFILIAAFSIFNLRKTRAFSEENLA